MVKTLITKIVFCVLIVNCFLFNGCSTIALGPTGIVREKRNEVGIKSTFLIKREPELNNPSFEIQLVP